MCEPLRPKLTEPPEASDAFHDSPVAVTAVPDWVTRADHAWVTRWPPVRANASDHAGRAGPRLVTDTVAVKPVLQSLVV